MFFGTRRRLNEIIRQNAVLARDVNEIHRLLTEMKMPQESFEELKTAVEKSTTVKQAAMELIRHMGEKLNDMANHPDPNELRRLAQELSQSAQDLSDKIADHDQ